MDERSKDHEENTPEPGQTPATPRVDEASVSAIISYQRFSEQLSHLRHKLLRASANRTHLLLYTVLALTVGVLGVLLYPGTAKREGSGAAEQAANRKAHPALYEALLAKDFEKVTALLKLGSGWEAINKPFVEGYALLHFAAQLGNAELAALAIEYGATIDMASESGGTPLMFASMLGHQPIVELLIAHRANVDLKANNGQSPLTMAAHNGHLGVVKVLLANGADADTRNAEQETALHVANFQGHDAVVEHLISEGFDVNARDYRGRTPLFLAIDGEHFRCAQLLVNNGADVSVKSTLGETPLGLAKRLQVKPNRFVTLLQGGGQTPAPK